MTVQVDVWLRGDDFATTEAVPGIIREPKEWVDEDVRRVLEGMLQAMHRLRYPDDRDHQVFLRGLSWIVNPYEDGGVVIAIEIALGAAIAGPFEIEQAALEKMIERVLADTTPNRSSSVH
jgi:hypothetical protein